MTDAAAALENLDRTTRLIPGGAASLAQMSDEELLANTRRLVGKSNQLLAALLLHLAEVEVRGVHRTKRCASLYTYCIYELRFSEDAAARRSAAARLVKQFPALLDAVADGELHLTGLLMIGPHLTLENQTEVLGRARFRTKKELAKLIRELHPLPGVPDLVQPLGPDLMMKRLRTPTWAEFVESFCPPVRELPPSDRPSAWANDGVVEMSAGDRALPVGPVPADLPPVTSPQLYQVQFSTVEEHVQLIERAKALMARERPGVSLGELHVEAMRLLVASLEKRKFAAGVSTSPRRRGSEVSAPSQRGGDVSAPRQRASAVKEPPETLSLPKPLTPPRRCTDEVGTFPQRCAAKCSSATRGAAAMSTIAASAAAKRATSSCIISNPSPRAGPTELRIWRCAAQPTTVWPPNWILDEITRRRSATGRGTSPSRDRPSTNPISTDGGLRAARAIAGADHHRTPFAPLASRRVANHRRTPFVPPCDRFRWPNPFDAFEAGGWSRCGL